MTLQPTFSLGPRSSRLAVAGDYRARISVHGVSFFPRYDDYYRFSFDHQHVDDELFFYNQTAADPSVDYSYWSNRQRVPHVELFFNLTSFGTQKELALVFGFDVFTESRLLVFSDAGQLDDETLAVGDNHFLTEIENQSLSLYLYFIHARKGPGRSGGDWFFRGVTGYVV